ncbi:hypothetical protein LTR53_018979, partial [Teratosphaeriaceae sp. CCFEE 6253]
RPRPRPKRPRCPQVHLPRRPRGPGRRATPPGHHPARPGARGELLRRPAYGDDDLVRGYRASARARRRSRRRLRGCAGGAFGRLAADRGVAGCAGVAAGLRGWAAAAAADGRGARRGG